MFLSDSDSQESTTCIIPADVENSIRESIESSSLNTSRFIPLSTHLLTSQCTELQRLIDDIPIETFKELDTIAQSYEEYFVPNRCPKKKIVITDYPDLRTISSIGPPDSEKIIRFPCITTTSYFTFPLPEQCDSICKKCKKSFTTAHMENSEITKYLIKTGKHPKIKCTNCSSSNIKITSKNTQLNVKYVQRLTVRDLESSETIDIFCFDEYVNRLKIGSCAYIT